MSIPTPPAYLPGYEHIPRTWNRGFGRYIANVVPGEFYVTEADEWVSTTLGSCIAVCVRDKVKGIGGLNHFMLPEKKDNGTLKDDPFAYGKEGDWAMEFLINGILLNGGERSNLETKYFGGAQLIKSLAGAEIGKRNIEFVQSYLQRERLPVLSNDVGDSCPRKVMFHPSSGSVKLKRLAPTNSQSILKAEEKYGGKLNTHDSSSGEIDLF